MINSFRLSTWGTYFTYLGACSDDYQVFWSISIDIFNFHLDKISDIKNEKKRKIIEKPQRVSSGKSHLQESKDQLVPFHLSMQHQGMSLKTSQQIPETKDHHHSIQRRRPEDVVRRAAWVMSQNGSNPVLILVDFEKTFLSIFHFFDKSWMH